MPLTATNRPGRFPIRMTPAPILLAACLIAGLFAHAADPTFRFRPGEGRSFRPARPAVPGARHELLRWLARHPSSSRRITASRWTTPGPSTATPRRPSWTAISRCSTPSSTPTSFGSATPALSDFQNLVRYNHFDPWYEQDGSINPVYPQKPAHDRGQRLCARHPRGALPALAFGPRSAGRAGGVRAGRRHGQALHPAGQIDCHPPSAMIPASCPTPSATRC